MIERYEFPKRPGDDLRAAIAEWLAFHGFDPTDVIAANGWIERDPDAYAVRALVFITIDDATGCAVIDGTMSIKITKMGVVREQRSEGPPLPFPPIPDGRWSSIRTECDPADGRPYRITTVVR